MVCIPCTRGECQNCVDILRIVYATKTICRCEKRGHSGEPRDQQVLDPETSTVHAPGLSVDIHGEVTRNGIV